MRNKLYIFFILIFTFVGQAFSCRFTVREIGFSTLSSYNYSLVYIASRADLKKLSYPDLKNLLDDSNIGLLFLDPEIDQNHPALKAAIKAGANFPQLILLSPDGRILLFDEPDLDEVINEIALSPLSEIFISNFYNRFAYVLMVESNNADKNHQAKEILSQACADITNRMPNMPKQVKNGPAVLILNQDKLKNEKVILWSLGIEKIPDNPIAFVIYGRGRIIGDIISYEDIIDNRVFQYLAMIGADCECGLDRKWMLGSQIPMNWPSSARQNLTDELGFDVDNPVIMAEMSYIMSKDPIDGSGSELTFAPKELNLDDLYQTDASNEKVQTEQKKRTFSPLIFIIFISALVVITGLSIFFIKKNRS